MAGANENRMGLSNMGWGKQIGAGLTNKGWG